MSMEIVIISKSKYDEMVGKLNRLSDRVNEILRKREGKRLSRWMDNQEVCQHVAHQSAHLADVPRQRHAGLLANRA